MRLFLDGFWIFWDKYYKEIKYVLLVRMIVSVTREHLETFKVQELKRKCKDLKITKYSKNKKDDLICKILKYISCRIIQRWYRKKIACNDICPISQESISFPCWPKKMSFNKKTTYTYYNLEPLLNYLVSSGDFRDPGNRTIYTDKELESMDKLSKSCGFKNNLNVQKAKKRRKFYQNKKIRDEQIDIISERIRSSICNIRNKLERILYDFENINDLTVKLEVSYFNSIKDYLHILYGYDKRTCKVIIQTMHNIINDVKCFECPVIKHMKSEVHKWIDIEKDKYNFD